MRSLLLRTQGGAIAMAAGRRRITASSRVYPLVWKAATITQRPQQQQQQQQFQRQQQQQQFQRQQQQQRTALFWSSATATPTNLPTTTPPDHEKLPVPKLIDLSVAAKIEGEESQIATVQLQPGETLRAESGSMIYMTHGVEMDTNLGGGGAGSSALGSAMKRFLTGQNVFLTDFTYSAAEGRGTVALGTDFPSKILRLNLDEMPAQALICQRGAYLASNPSVNIEMEFTKSLTAGFFGGQGFILQRLSGQGDVLVKGGGTIVVQDLQPGEVLRVTSGSIVAFEPTVQYDVQMIPGIRNVMFGGEGLFLTSLTGPGRVWLQSMPPDRMIAEIARRMPSGGPGIGIPIAVGGGGGGTADDASGTATPDATGTEAVVAGDAAVEADRAATVASSGMSGPVDADSPSALFGDAAPKDTTAATSTPMSPSSPVGDDDNSTVFSTSSSSSSGTPEPSFSDDPFSTENNPNQDALMDDSEFAANKDNDEFFSNDDSTTTTEGLSSSSSSDMPASSEDSSSGLLGMLWDLFTGRDDE